MMTPARTVFFLTTNGMFGSFLTSTLSNLYSFTGGSDGNTPVCAAGSGRRGRISSYGSTEYGGEQGLGNVFRISTNGLIANVYSTITDGVDDSFPTNALMCRGPTGVFTASPSLVARIRFGERLPADARRRVQHGVFVHRRGGRQIPERAAGPGSGRRLVWHREAQQVSQHLNFMG